MDPTRHRQRAPMGGVLAAVIVLVLAGVAVAQTSGGSLGGGQVGTGVSVPGGTGTSGGGSSGGSSGGGGSVPTCTAQGVTGPISYRPVTDAEAAGLAVAGPRVDEINPGHSILVANPGDGSPGAWYAKSCGDAQAGYIWSGTSPAAPPPPPPAPTADEMWRNTPLPTPAFGISPVGTGLTGLSTQLWDSTAPAPVTATATIRGYVSVATATPQSWRWNMTDSGPASRANPPGTVSSSWPGTEARPAATYTYETKGGYGLTLTVTWGGSFVYSGNGTAPTTRSLGTTTRTANRSYDVSEIRPVLVAR